MSNTNMGFFQKKTEKISKFCPVLGHKLKNVAKSLDEPSEDDSYWADEENMGELFILKQHRFLGKIEDIIKELKLSDEIKQKCYDLFRIC